MLEIKIPCNNYEVGFPKGKPYVYLSTDVNQVGTLSAFSQIYGTRFELYLTFTFLRKDGFTSIKFQADIRDDQIRDPLQCQQLLRMFFSRPVSVSFSDEQHYEVPPVSRFIETPERVWLISDRAGVLDWIQSLQETDYETIMQFIPHHKR